MREAAGVEAMPAWAELLANLVRPEGAAISFAAPCFAVNLVELGASKCRDRHLMPPWLLLPLKLVMEI